MKPFEALVDEARVRPVVVAVFAFRVACRDPAVRAASLERIIDDSGHADQPEKVALASARILVGLAGKADRANFFDS
jgi:hypothetical protein